MNVQDYINLPKEQKWWQKNSVLDDEINDVPIICNRTDNVKNSEFIQLHEDIVKLVYDFVKTHDIEGAYKITFGIDEIQELAKYGTDCASCDSHLGIYDKDNNDIIFSM